MVPSDKALQRCGVAPGTKSMQNSTSVVGGMPGIFYGKTSENSQTTGIPGGIAQ